MSSHPRLLFAMEMRSRKNRRSRRSAKAWQMGGSKVGFEQSLISEVNIGVIRISGYLGEVVVSIKILIDFLVICPCLNAFFGYF